MVTKILDLKISLNRVILSKIPSEKLTSENLNLSCGEFEHPDYVGSNANVEYAMELSSKPRYASSTYRPIWTSIYVMDRRFRI